MAGKKYEVHLSEEERTYLRTLVKRGEAKVRTILRAQAFLLSNEGRTDSEIRAVLHLSRGTLYNWRKRLAEEGLEVALHDRPRPGAKRKLDAKGEATLIALACSDPPDGREHWTMQLLADRLVELGVVESISDETVRRTLKKTGSSPGRRNTGVSRR
jgi:transposase